MRGRLCKREEERKKDRERERDRERGEEMRRKGERWKGGGICVKFHTGN